MQLLTQQIVRSSTRKDNQWLVLHNMEILRSCRVTLKDLKKHVKIGILDKYGKAGVEALSSATPKDSGKLLSHGLMKSNVKMELYH